ncbi:hypothetical protein [Peribacillus loiseleuriae]|uniref:Lipoprotein n=1 Tax=Peribacillus loiseleuriae TaxID=1679170 RepID=A0A0K9GYY8_9BACI|nr:hypothetical protein [Peribacillus loiseleuriae]KMY51939.1 hypothetical protein AC625_22435 [Peribacillus loiseleuriae]
MVKKRILALLGCSFLSMMMLAGCATTKNNPAPEQTPTDNNLNQPTKEVNPNVNPNDNTNPNGTDTNLNGTDTNMNDTLKHKEHK